MKPVFFATPADWRRWLAANHASCRELWVGFHKKDSGRPSVTWPEARDQALCFGWIDGVRRSLDETSYVNRFTPRRSSSHWSLVNLKRFRELKAQGLVRAPGLRAFEQRKEERTGRASYEQRTTARLSRAQEEVFKAVPAAWSFFKAQPPGYRRITIWFVISAKKEETRARRLGVLIECSAAGRRIDLLTGK